jgi:hypothetical protein
MSEPINQDSFVVCVPINVDAFILNPAVCQSGQSRIAPITQPDYLGLRPVNTEIRADILPNIDVTTSQPASVNSRITTTENSNAAQIDPTKPASDAEAVPVFRQNRIGVHVHWSLPRCYRAGTGGADDVPSAPKDSQLVGGENRTPVPGFRPVPNRWCVVRNVTSSTPAAPPNVKMKGWVIESDRLWSVDELGPDVDLETDVSPYLNYKISDESSADLLNNQSGVYIGAKMDAETWTERFANVPRVPLTTMNSSNIFFADNTDHNSNVLSMIDNFQYTDATGKILYLQKVTCDYIVLGWHSDPTTDPLGPPNGLQGALSDRLKALFLSLDPRNNSTRSALMVCHGTIYNVQYDSASKPTTPADQFGQLFTADTKMEPVSVGTTGLDAILAFLQAHETDADPIFGPGSSSVAQEVMSLSQLLYATQDDYDQRTKASDLVYAHSFGDSEGGRGWHYDGRAGIG